VKDAFLRIAKSPWAKGGLAIAILATLILFGRFDLSSLQVAMRSWPWLLAGLLVMLPPYAIVSLRFKIVLESFELPVSLRDAVRWTMIGSFFDIAMPGSSGGDLVKIGYVTGHYGKGYRTKSVMAILVDRVAGLIGLFIIAFLACTLGWTTVSRLSNSRFLLFGLGLVCLGTVLAFLFLTWPRLAESSRMKQAIGAFPFGSKALGAYAAFASLRRKKHYLAYVLMLSLANHLFWCSSILCIARSTGLSVPIAQGFVIFPLAIFFNVFGFAGGFGVGTVSFGLLFTTLLGSTSGTVVGLMYQCLSVISRLGGLPFFLFTKAKTNESIARIRYLEETERSE